MLSSLAIILSSSLCCPLGYASNSFSRIDVIDNVSTSNSAIINFNNFMYLRSLNLSFSLDNMSISSSFNFDILSNFNYMHFRDDTSGESVNYDYLYSSLLTFDTTLNSDYITLINDKDFLAHLTGFEFSFNNFFISYITSEGRGIYQCRFNCDLSLTYSFSYRDSSNNSIKSFNVVNNYSSIFGSSGFTIITNDFTDVNGVRAVLSTLKSYNKNSSYNLYPINSMYDSFSYKFSYRELWRNYTQVDLDNNQDWYQTGIKDGYDKGFLDGQSSKIVDNPINIAFNGIKNVLDIEIFPHFKLSYALGFSCMVMIVRFALSFFH